MNDLSHDTAQAEAPAIPPVIVTLPGDLSSEGTEVLIRHEPWGVEVDVRPARTGFTWTPVKTLGGTFEVRTS